MGDPASGNQVAEWGSFLVALVTLIGGGILRVLRRITRLERRVAERHRENKRRLDAIEELAGDAYQEAALARSMIEGRQIKGGRRTWDP